MVIRMNGKKSKYTKVTARQGWLSVAPVLILILVIRGYPLIVGFLESFTNWNGMSQNDFLGFSNYINILKDPVFWELLKNNFLFMLFIPIQLIIGIIVAVLFYEETAGWKFFRNVFYLPQIISSTVIGFLFSVFFSYRGPVNAVLKVFGVAPREWLGEKGSAIVIILICLVWVNIGWQAMLGLGGLGSIPTSVFEAAKIDGAGYWQRLFKITIPLLGRTIEYSCVMSIIWVLTGLFPFIFSMTKGGPGYDTSTIDYMIYQKSFGTSSEMGYACAMSVILLIIVSVLTMLQMKLSDKANEWGDE